MASVKTKITRIGNSPGVRIPLNMLTQAGLGSSVAEVVGQSVELDAEEDGIKLRPLRPARAGWAEQFAAMSRQGDDLLLDDVPQVSSWDEQEWEWD